MVFAFYKVGNSKDYCPSSFNLVYNNRREILRMLKKLKDDEWRTYDFHNDDERRDFVEDYNAEELDGGWWCIEIPD